MVDPMAGPLALHAAADQLRELVVGCSGAERPAEIHLVEREETGAELSLRREPQAVARVAERLRDGGDDADAAWSAVCEAVGRRGLARVGLRLQGEDGRDALQ